MWTVADPLGKTERHTSSQEAGLTVFFTSFVYVKGNIHFEKKTTNLFILKGVLQNSLRFSFGNFSAHNALRISILDIFSTALCIGCSKLSKILTIEQHLTKL